MNKLLPIVIGCVLAVTSLAANAVEQRPSKQKARQAQSMSQDKAEVSQSDRQEQEQAHYYRDHDRRLDWAFHNRHHRRYYDGYWYDDDYYYNAPGVVIRLP